MGWAQWKPSGKPGEVRHITPLDPAAQEAGSFKEGWRGTEGHATQTHRD